MEVHDKENPVSHKLGHRCLAVCVDDDSGRLILAAVGRDKKTLCGFFDLVVGERCCESRPPKVNGKSLQGFTALSPSRRG
ncbi:MAG: hypothetical protein ACYDGN_12770 [Acidimicrobiales bacterium]